MTQPVTTIHIAVTHHEEHGTRGFAARTREGLDRQLAAYCRENWEEEGIPDSPPANDEDCLILYFRHVREREYCIYEPTDLLP